MAVSSNTLSSSDEMVLSSSDALVADLVGEDATNKARPSHRLPVIGNDQIVTPSPVDGCVPYEERVESSSVRKNRGWGWCSIGSV